MDPVTSSTLAGRPDQDSSSPLSQGDPAGSGAPLRAAFYESRQSSQCSSRSSFRSSQDRSGSPKDSAAAPGSYEHVVLPGDCERERLMADESFALPRSGDGFATPPAPPEDLPPSAKLPRRPSRDPLPLPAHRVGSENGSATASAGIAEQGARHESRSTLSAPVEVEKNRTFFFLLAEQLGVAKQRLTAAVDRHLHEVEMTMAAASGAGTLQGFGVNSRPGCNMHQEHNLPGAPIGGYAAVSGYGPRGMAGRRISREAEANIEEAARLLEEVQGVEIPFIARKPVAALSSECGSVCTSRRSCTLNSINSTEDLPVARRLNGSITGKRMSGRTPSINVSHHDDSVSVATMSEVKKVGFADHGSDVGHIPSCVAPWSHGGWELLPYWERSADEEDDDLARTFAVSEIARPVTEQDFLQLASLTWRNASSLNMSRGRGDANDYHFMRSTAVLAQRLVISPFASWKVAWDLVGMFLICYDTITVPLLVFDLPDNALMVCMMWFAMIFWLIDLGFSFFTGLYDQSTTKVEMRLPRIACKYLRSWFILDIIVVSPDWIFFAYGRDNQGTTRLGKAFRALRALRALRLLRLAKIRKMVHQMESRLSNEYLVCYLQLVKIMVSIAVLNHILACGWFGMSKVEEEDRGWVERHSYSGRDTTFLYLTSLHWALSLFQGTMEVFPGTISERAFAVAVQFLGLLIVSYFISSITHFMTEIRRIRATVMQRRSQLIRYLCDRNISADLSVRVKQFADKVVRTENTKEEEVELLRFLPEDMRKDLDLEIKGPALGVHPLLSNLVCESKNLAMRFLEIIIPVSMHYGEVLFRRCEESVRLLVVMEGRLVYDKDPKKQEASGHHTSFTHKNLLFRPVCVEAVEWLCEISWWTSWTHMGEITARSHCEVMSIARERLAEITATLDQHQVDLVHSHARNFMNWVNNQVTKAIDDLIHPPLMPEAPPPTARLLKSMTFGDKTTALGLSLKRKQSRIVSE